MVPKMVLFNIYLALYSSFEQKICLTKLIKSDFF